MAAERATLFLAAAVIATSSVTLDALWWPLDGGFLAEDEAANDLLFGCNGVGAANVRLMKQLRRQERGLAIKQKECWTGLLMVFVVWVATQMGGIDNNNLPLFSRVTAVAVVTLVVVI